LEQKLQKWLFLSPKKRNFSNTTKVTNRASLGGALGIIISKLWQKLNSWCPKKNPSKSWCQKLLQTSHLTSHRTQTVKLLISQTDMEQDGHKNRNPILLVKNCNQNTLQIPGKTADYVQKRAVKNFLGVFCGWELL